MLSGTNRAKAPSPGIRRNVMLRSVAVRSTRLSPTEARNPRSLRLDRLPLEQAVQLMLSEEARVARQVLRERAKLVRAIKLIAKALRRGGRLFYVGAGTSGRLGALDASECPPTFRTNPKQVQAIIAGGRQALWNSIEGAEDDSRSGMQAIRSQQVGSIDMVIGIAASGTTPFVWGAIKEAKRRQAVTVLICFNPYLSIPASLRPALVIAPVLGPEVLTGSTRLKAGTATKLILNLFSTLAMVRLGKVRSNLMVDLKPANRKLRDRAVRIVMELTGADSLAAAVALRSHSWQVAKTVDRLERHGCGSVSMRKV